MLIGSLAVSCASRSAVGEDSDETTSIPPQAPDDIPIDRVAICVWDKVGLRVEAGEKKYTKDGKNNYVETIYYGERVELLGEEEFVKERNRTYMRVRLKDGQEGWVHDYVFEQHGRLAAVVKPAEIYRRPDPMTLRDDRIMPGEIVVVIEDSIPQPGWLHISGREKRKKGWVQNEAFISFAPQDIKAALLYFRATQEPPGENRLNRLKAILADTTLRQVSLLAFIEEQLRQGAPPGSTTPEADPDKLFITQAETPIRNEPEENPDNIITQLQAGDVCTILSRGRKITIDDKTDYWYRVQYGDAEGWVYGYYTSKRSLN
ncbi:MAG: hypothetical protein OHK0039_32060 [Bacteroidia bacterium]